jgi:glucokinase
LFLRILFPFFSLSLFRVFLSLIPLSLLPASGFRLPASGFRLPASGIIMPAAKSFFQGGAVSPAQPEYVLSFDVGGSHVTAGLCRLNDLEVLRMASAPLAGMATFDSFVDLLYKLTGQVSAQGEEPSGASLAVPFPFDCEAGVSLMKHKLTPLYGKNLRAALATRFGWTPSRLRFLNDASAYLLGELAAGSAKGAARAAGLTLGTGIGSAFAVSGHSVTSGDGVPPEGEIWNLPYAGASERTTGGTVEDLLSTRAIQAAYQSRTGRDQEVADLAAAAPQDADARAVFEEFGTHLGQVLRDVIAPFHPDRVVLGGGIARAAALFLPAAEKQIAGLGFHAVISALFDRAPLVGAANFWREETEVADRPASGTACPAKL